MSRSVIFRTLASACAIGVGLAGVPTTAHALSCVGDFWRLPDTGGVDVPTNTLLWGYIAKYDQLRGPSGEVIEVDERQLRIETLAGGGPSGLMVLVPRTELQPNAEYTIVRDFTSDPTAGEHITFRTAAGPATTAPPLPVLVASEVRTGSSWLGSPARYQTLDFEGIVEGQLALLGDLADSAEGDTGPLEALASVRELLISPTDTRGPVLEWVSEHQTLSVGVGDCSVWPPGAADRQDARFGTFDLAGNFSGWIDVPLQLPSREEAQAELDRQDAERALEQAEAASRNIQEPRSAIAGCSTAAPSNGASHVAWLSLALALTAASYRRRTRR